MPVHFSPSSNRKEPTQILQDELFPTSTFNKPHLSPTSQRKPGCFSSSRTLTLPGTINIYDMGWSFASRAICPATDKFLLNQFIILGSRSCVSDKFIHSSE
ncbi:hypothetical protein TNCV_2349701 [Trichonephila clavipes]|uniref:Uncharacterized protein n=1 Tax=Trichonephila clavipes TaxID=2585209 RepID=A0A8X6VQJ7_TRICX|nr:hypothetical protein TNCV_2349701 [Trichonephila clavipes]